jgi:hypothetical protein
MGMNNEEALYTITIYKLQKLNFDFGLNDYPIWNEDYRPILNNAILEYYLFREICFVNPIRWRRLLRNRMSIIMRNKYNALYNAKAKDFNPLYTMEMYEEYSHNVENTGTNTNNGETNYTTNSEINNTNSQTTEDTTTNHTSSLQITSNYPSEEMTENDLSSNLYVDGATKNTSDTNGSDNTTSNGTDSTINTGTDKTINSANGSNTNNTTESYSKKTYGSASDLSFAHAMVQFKDYCDQYNLDQQVIDELKDLFMNIW